MAKAMLRACSVLQFHASKTLVPNCGRGDGGATKTGRPLSNKPASSVPIREPFGVCPGLPKTITSKAGHGCPQNRPLQGHLPATCLTALLWELHTAHHALA